MSFIDMSGDGEPFTSGLTVKEFALLSQLGDEPLAQVMGSSVIHTGWQYLPALPAADAVVAFNPRYGRVYGQQLQNRYTEASLSTQRDYVRHHELVCTLDVLTDAWSRARREALDGLREQARQAGADAVVAVDLRRSDHDLGRDVVEVLVTGTAIADPGLSAEPAETVEPAETGEPGESAPPGAAPDPGPVLTDLSVQDYWRLRRAGHRPVGLLASTSVVFASPSRVTRRRRIRGARRNQELTELSRGVHAARSVIRAQMCDQISDVSGTGAVGVEMTHTTREQKLALGSSLTTEDQHGWNRSAFGLPYYVTGRTDVHRPGWVITMHGVGTAIVYRRGAAVSASTQLSIGGR